jgi:short-subunit dehydrogenase
MITKGSGGILNVNSNAGKIGFENFSSYCSSKFGLLGLAESVALEVATYNIRIMTIIIKLTIDQFFNPSSLQNAQLHTRSDATDANFNANYQIGLSNPP